MNELKVFDMCNDYMFKSVFRSMEARRIFARFLNEVTGIPLDILIKADYQAGEIPKQNENEKNKISDCIVRIANNQKLIVEMNNHKKTYTSKKATSYTYGVITESTGINDNYPDIQLICIDNFNDYNTKKEKLTFMSRDEDGNLENDLYKSIHIILENCKQTVYNEIRLFGTFLKMTTLKEMKEYFKGDKDYMDAIEKVEVFTKDPEFIGYYDAEKQHRIDLNEAHDAGIKQGIEQGFEKGIEQRNLEIAKNLKEQGLSVEIISKVTSLTKEKIDNL